MQLQEVKPKALLFDLGRVVFSLDWKRPVRLLNISKTNGEDLLIHRIQSWLPYDRYERGLIGFSQFLSAVNQTLETRFTESEFLLAWMSILTGYADGVQSLLSRLQARYPIYALTNTTDMHYEYMMKTHRADRYFKKIFTSFELGYRKPEKQIFESVLADLKLLPSEVLFVDDTLMHVESARRLGIQALHLTDGMSFERLLKTYGGIL